MTGTLIPDDLVEGDQILGHIINEKDLNTIPVIAPITGYLWQFGICHSGCDACLPAQHPNDENGFRLETIMTG